MIAHPFQPVYDKRAKVLVLGTLPSPASIKAGGYYGHPQNAFWPIMGELLSVPELRRPDWQFRYSVLKSVGIALWDVLAACERPGSSDARIRKPRPNDFIPLFEECPRLNAVLLNGRVAQRLWTELVKPGLYRLWERPAAVHNLPSTSPRHARSLAEKLRLWNLALLHERILIPATMDVD